MCISKRRVFIRGKGSEARGVATSMATSAQSGYVAERKQETATGNSTGLTGHVWRNERTWPREGYAF